MKPFDYYSTNTVPYPSLQEYKRKRREEIDNTPMTTAEREQAKNKLHVEAKDWFVAASAPYNEERRRLDAEFWADCLAELGYDKFLNNEGCGVLEAEAWERGHAWGYSEVFNCLCGLVDFVTRIVDTMKK
jgi:hypothetical protein